MIGGKDGCKRRKWRSERERKGPDHLSGCLGQLPGLDPLKGH